MTQTRIYSPYETQDCLTTERLRLVGNIQWICDTAFEKGVIPETKYDSFCSVLGQFRDLSMDYLYKLYEKVMSNDFTLRG